MSAWLYQHDYTLGITLYQEPNVTLHAFWIIVQWIVLSNYVCFRTIIDRLFRWYSYEIVHVFNDVISMLNQ